MSVFLSEREKQLADTYLENGHIIRPVAEPDSLEWIRQVFVDNIVDVLNLSGKHNAEDLLNHIHEYVPVSKLNAFRLEIIQKINATDNLREHYFRIARPYLEEIVGNELAMQLRVNLSIQLPADDSSLLPVHSDIWSGDSPFEVVVWLPLVNCYGTKAMYLLPPVPSAQLLKDFQKFGSKSSEDLYQHISQDVNWLEVKYGEVLLFDQGLPHGNVVNKESETRWSMNCRYKGVFTPYGDKKIGEFFEPITLRPASQRGMSYKLPSIS